VKSGLAVHVVHGEARDQQTEQRRQYRQRQAQRVGGEHQINPIVAAAQPTAERHCIGQCASEARHRQDQRRDAGRAQSRQHDAAGAPLVDFAAGVSE
jgi:hypothetical protein